MDSLQFQLDVGKSLEEVLRPNQQGIPLAPGTIDFSPVLKLVDEFFGLQASFLFVKKPSSQEELIVRGSTSLKVTPFQRGEVTLFDSRFLDLVSRQEAKDIRLERFEFSGDRFWELLWCVMELGPYTGPWRISAVPIATQRRELNITDVLGFLILVYADRRQEFDDFTFAHVKLVGAQLLMAIELSVSTQTLRDQGDRFLKALTNAGQDVQLHNIFSPLQLVELYAEKAGRAMRRHDDKEVAAAIEQMRRNAFDASRFAKTMLQASQALHPAGTHERHCNIGNVLDAIESSFRPYAEAAAKELVMRDEHKSEKDAAIAPMDLEEILGNLIHNAIKYGARNTKIKVTAKTSGDYHIIDVLSYGIEIRSEDQERVFMLGFRTAEAAQIEYNAVGFGLFRSRQLAANARGRLYIAASVPDELVGHSRVFRTTFRLRLPVL